MAIETKTSIRDERNNPIPLFIRSDSSVQSTPFEGHKLIRRTNCDEAKTPGGFRPDKGVSDGAFVDPRAVILPGSRVKDNCKIGCDVVIGRNAFIDRGVIVDAGAFIGDGVVIEAGTHIKKGASIGARARICPNAIIGENAAVLPKCRVGAGGVILSNHIYSGQPDEVDLRV